MTWRSVGANVLVLLLTLIHVAVCRLRHRRKSFADVDSAAVMSPILVVRCEAKIGDNLLNIPFLRGLRAQHPGREIHLLHHAAARAIYERCPYVDKRIEIAWPMSSPMTLLYRVSLSASVFRTSEASHRYGLAMVPRWDEDLYAPFLAWMSGAPRIVGFSRKVRPQKAWRNMGADLLYTTAVYDVAVRHESQRPLQLLDRGPHDKSPLASNLEFWFSDEDRARVTSLIGNAAGDERTWIAVAPGAALDRRKWPIDGFARLVEALGQRPDVRILLLGNSAEAAECDTLRSVGRSGAVLNVAGQLSLAETAAALQLCHLFVGNDSGLMHLACAVGTPVIEISCHPMEAPDLHANSPARFGPTGPHTAVLRPERPLAEACRDGCVFDTAHCITAVTVGAVRAAIESATTA